MNPQKGQHVKCVLRNNLVLDGIVESWSDSKSILRSLDESSISIIQHTSQDIVLVKIVLKEFIKIKNEAIKIKSELEEKFDEVYQQPSDDDLRIKNMAELKSLMAEQEKKIISEKIKDHRIGNVKGVKYGQPGFFPKPRVK